MVKQISKILMCLLLLPINVACAKTGTLYPTGDARNTMPRIKAQFEGVILYGSEKGGATVHMPNGERLTGEYRFIMNGKDGFGQLYSLLYRRMARKDKGTKTYAIGGGWGEINLTGNQGLYMNCEYYYDFRRSMGGGAVGGKGVCKDTNNIAYRLEF